MVMCTSGCQKLHNTLHPAGEEPVLPLRGGGCPEGDRAQRGWMGLPAPTLEGGYLPYTGQLVVHDHWGLPELQVGLPGDKRSKTKGGDRQCPVRACLASFQSHSGIFHKYLLCTSCKQEVEAQRGRGPCPRSHSMFAKGLRPDPGPSCFGIWLMVGGGDGLPEMVVHFIAPAGFKCLHAPRAKDHNIQVGWVCSPQVPKSPSDDLVSPVDVSRLHIAQAAGLCAGQQNQVSLGWGAGWEMTALYGGREGGDQWWW